MTDRCLLVGICPDSLDNAISNSLPAHHLANGSMSQLRTQGVEVRYQSYYTHKELSEPLKLITPQGNLISSPPSHSVHVLERQRSTKMHARKKPRFLDQLQVYNYVEGDGRGRFSYTLTRRYCISQFAPLIETSPSNEVHSL